MAKYTNRVNQDREIDFNLYLDQKVGDAIAGPHLKVKHGGYVALFYYAKPANSSVSGKNG